MNRDVPVTFGGTPSQAMDEYLDKRPKRKFRLQACHLLALLILDVMLLFCVGLLVGHFWTLQAAAEAL